MWAHLYHSRSDDDEGVHPCISSCHHSAVTVSTVYILFVAGQPHRSVHARSPLVTLLTRSDPAAGSGGDGGCGEAGGRHALLRRA